MICLTCGFYFDTFFVGLCADTVSFEIFITYYYFSSWITVEKIHLPPIVVFLNIHSVQHMVSFNAIHWLWPPPQGCWEVKGDEHICSLSFCLHQYIHLCGVLQLMFVNKFIVQLALWTLVNCELNMCCTICKTANILYSPCIAQVID